jgi:hypothetical protein
MAHLNIVQERGFPSISTPSEFKSMDITAWLHSDDITMEQFQLQLPTSNRFFICHREAGFRLYNHLCTANLIMVYRGSGCQFTKEFAPHSPSHKRLLIGRQAYQLEGVEYQIWGPGDSLGVANVTENKCVIDIAIRSYKCPHGTNTGFYRF